jgi:ABC-type lipoprotein release transport system permease subunit
VPPTARTPSIRETAPDPDGTPVATDPLVFGIVAVALMTVAVAASAVPSLRIARIRPANALRYE